MVGGTGHVTQSRAVRCAHGRTSYRSHKSGGARADQSAADGYFVRAPSDNLQHKTWQPRGGDIPFTIHLTQNFDNDTAVRVCVRWHLDGSKHQDFFEASARIDSIAASKQEV